MAQVIKLRRNGVEAEVVDKYVGQFLADGWEKVSEFTGELGAKSTEEAEERAQEESLKQAHYELKDAEEEKDCQERGQAKIEREKQELDRKHQQDALNHSRGNIDHAKNIVDLEDKDAVREYVKANFNKDVDLRGSLEVVKEKALLISKEVH